MVHRRRIGRPRLRRYGRRRGFGFGRRRRYRRGYGAFAGPRASCSNLRRAIGYAHGRRARGKALAIYSHACRRRGGFGRRRVHRY